MSGGKMAAAELVKFSDADFEKTIQKMDLKDLLDAISVLQREMTREQANFNALSNELGMLNKNSRQYRQISKEMTVSQNKLTTLMDRSMKCFQQQGQQHITKQTESSTTVQRRNSSKETKDSSQMVPVQRRHSGKLPNTDAELIKSSMDKKTKSQPSTGGQPVILKPLSNVDNKNIAVKKPPAPGETRQDAVKAMQPANQTRVNGVDGSVSGQSKLQTNIINVSSTKTSVSNGDNSVRSSATFSFGGSKPSEQKPNSTKVVVNGSVERSDIKNSIISESRKPAASNLTKSGNVSNGGGESMYDARNKIFEEIKRFDKKSELTKAAPKPTQPVEVNLDFSASAPNKQPAPVVEKQEVKVQPSANVTRVKVSSQKQAVQKPDKPKTQVQVNQTQDKVIEMQDKVTRTQNLTKTETKTQNVTQAVKPVTKPQVKNQFDKLLSDKGESETDSDDDAQSPRRGEPEKFVSQVTFNHKPLNKVNSNVTVADVKLKKTEPVPKAGVTSTGASASSTKG